MFPCLFQARKESTHLSICWGPELKTTPPVICIDPILSSWCLGRGVGGARLSYLPSCGMRAGRDLRRQRQQIAKAISITPPDPISLAGSSLQVSRVFGEATDSGLGVAGGLRSSTSSFEQEVLCHIGSMVTFKHHHHHHHQGSVFSQERPLQWPLVFGVTFAFAGGTTWERVRLLHHITLWILVFLLSVRSWGSGSTSSLSLGYAGGICFPPLCPTFLKDMTSAWKPELPHPDSLDMISWCCCWRLTDQNLVWRGPEIVLVLEGAYASNLLPIMVRV